SRCASFGSYCRSSVTTRRTRARAAGTSTVHVSARCTWPRRTGAGRPGRGGFRNAMTFVSTKRTTAARPKTRSAHLKTIRSDAQVDLPEGLDAIPQLGRALEVEPPRRVFHGSLELLHVRREGGRALP